MASLERNISFGSTTAGQLLGNRAQVFIFMQSKLKPHRWVPIYVAQSENINVRSHKRQLRECVDHHGATHIHVRIVEGEDDRVAEEKDLLQKWKTPCNSSFSS